MKRYLLVASVAVLAAVSTLGAGPYSDDLAKCLVESTTKEDRAGLVRWMFAAASRHPEVQSLATVSEAGLDEANERTAALFTRLLTESCRDEARTALTYEGQATIGAGFQVLGQVAGQELFTSPEVAASLSALEDYLDADKLEAALTGDGVDEAGEP